MIQFIRDPLSFEIRFKFESAVPIRFHSKAMSGFKNFRIGHACPLLVVVKRLKPLTVLSGTVYRLTSSMSDHTPVLFNVFEDWNEESAVPHISAISNRNAQFNSRFDLNTNGRFAGPTIHMHRHCGDMSSSDGVGSMHSYHGTLFLPG